MEFTEEFLQHAPCHDEPLCRPMSIAGKPSLNCWECIRCMRSFEAGKKAGYETGWNDREADLIPPEPPKRKRGRPRKVES